MFVLCVIKAVIFRRYLCQVADHQCVAKARKSGSKHHVRSNNYAPRVLGKFNIYYQDVLWRWELFIVWIYDKLHLICDRLWSHSSILVKYFFILDRTWTCPQSMTELYLWSEGVPCCRPVGLVAPIHRPVHSNSRTIGLCPSCHPSCLWLA